MNGMSSTLRPMLEELDRRPVVRVAEQEYRRLLGYPAQHVPGERAGELAAAARAWDAEHGRPWTYFREAALEISDDTLRLEGREFRSPALLAHFQRTGAVRVVLLAVSAGGACEEEAGRLWREGKPDEYFFLEMFGSAVVEQLVADLNGRLCDLAEREGLRAVPHFSPGYTGWDVAEQPQLFELITAGRAGSFGDSLAVLPSGMLRPKKSLLAIVGFTARTAAGRMRTPCEACSFSPCQYRRAAYRSMPAPPGAIRVAPAPSDSPLEREARYTVNGRALQKWSRERVHVSWREDGLLSARFRFDGTTCSSQGRPLAFDYAVTLSGPEDGYTILRADCRPAPGDDGYTAMCAYLSDGDALLQSIVREQPLLGRPLNDVLGWTRNHVPTGCHCTADSRIHKWGLALEAIHYTLARNPPVRSTIPVSSP